MKKGLGLQANISSFNTTLPQTKHLNFFMGTNPVGYANGGDVRRGVPSSNMNVTQGFLPMALGFDNGGDVGVYSAVVKTIANYLVKTQSLFSGKSENDPEVIQAAETIAQNNPDIINVIQESNYGSGTSAGAYDSGFPIREEPKLPTETAADDFSSAADATKNIRPDSVKQDQFTGLESAGVISPSTLGETGDSSGNILDTIIDFGGNLKDEFFPAPTIKQTGGDASVMEEIMKAREDAPQVKEEEIKKSESKESTDGGITTITGQGSGKSAGAYDSGFPINKKEEKELQKTIKDATDNKDKKDAPSWALPLMSAGFAMMASKSPNFLQALGEAGQEGIKTLTAQQESKLDREDRVAARDLQKAQAAYYRGEGRSAEKIYVQDGIVGTISNGKFTAVTDNKGEPLKKVITDAEAAEYLKNDATFQAALQSGDTAKMAEMIQNVKNGLSGINTSGPVELSKEDTDGVLDFIFNFGGNLKDQFIS
jgi:hypothetical protein